MKPSPILPIHSSPVLYLHFNPFHLLSNHFFLSFTSLPLCVCSHCISPAKETLIANRNDCLVKSASALIGNRERRLNRPECWWIGKKLLCHPERCQELVSSLETHARLEHTTEWCEAAKLANE